MDILHAFIALQLLALGQNLRISDEIQYFWGTFYFILSGIFFITLSLYRLGNTRNGPKIKQLLLSTVNILVGVAALSVYLILLTPPVTPIYEINTWSLLRDSFDHHEINHAILQLDLKEPLYISINDPILPLPIASFKSPIPPEKLNSCFLFQNPDRPFDLPGIYIISYTIKCHDIFSNTITQIVNYSPRLLPIVKNITDGYNGIHLEFPRDVISCALNDSNHSHSNRNNNDDFEDDEEIEVFPIMTVDRKLKVESFEVHLSSENSKNTIRILDVDHKTGKNVHLHLEPISKWKTGDSLVISVNPKLCFEAIYPNRPCENATLHLPLAPPISFNTKVQYIENQIQLIVTFSAHVLQIWDTKDSFFDFDEDDDETSDMHEYLDIKDVFGELLPEIFSVYHISAGSNNTIPALSVTRNLKKNSTFDQYFIALDLSMDDLYDHDTLFVNLSNQKVVGVETPRQFLKANTDSVLIRKGFCCNKSQCHALQKWPESCGEISTDYSFNLEDIFHKKIHSKNSGNVEASDQIAEFKTMYVDQELDFKNIALDRPYAGVGVYTSNETMIYIKNRVKITGAGFFGDFQTIAIDFSEETTNVKFIVLNQTISMIDIVSKTRYIIKLSEAVEKATVALVQCNDAKIPFGDCLQSQWDLSIPQKVRILDAVIFENATACILFSEHVKSIESMSMFTLEAEDIFTDNDKFKDKCKLNEKVQRENIKILEMKSNEFNEAEYCISFEQNYVAEGDDVYISVKLREETEKQEYEIKGKFNWNLQDMDANGGDRMVILVVILMYVGLNVGALMLMNAMLMI